MKSENVTSSTYIDFNVENTDKGPKFEIIVNHVNLKSREHIKI